MSRTHTLRVDHLREARPGARQQKPRDIAEGGLLTYARPMAKKIKCYVDGTNFFANGRVEGHTVQFVAMATFEIVWQGG